MTERRGRGCCTVIFIGTHRVKEGKFDDFKKLLQAFCDEVVEGQEPRLLAYNGYGNDDGSEVSVVQVHPVPASMLFHMQVAADLTANGLASGSVRRIFAVLREVLQAAEESRMLSRSPCLGVTLPAPRVPSRGFLSAEELAALTEAHPDRYRAVPFLGGYGGLRWAELVGLRLPRIDFLRSRVTVAEALVELAGRFHPGPTKTGNVRVVTLPRSVTECLSAHVAAFPPGTSGLVFTDGSGGPIRHSNYRRRVFIPALGRARLPHAYTPRGGACRWCGTGSDAEGHERPVRIHDLRHTAVALAIGAGAHPKAIQERPGHASITTTLNVYGQLFPVLDEELAERLQAGVSPRIAGPMRDREGTAAVLGLPG